MTGDPLVGPYTSYKDVAYAAFGRKGQAAVIIGILGHQLCIASGWVIVITNTTQTLLEDFPRIAIVCWFLPILFMLSLIRYVKHLVPFSFFGCMVYAFGIIGVTYVFVFSDIRKDEWAERMTLWNWKLSPLFMSTYTYAIEGIIGVLPNESSLKKPEQANSFIAFSLFFYGINALLFALFAYLGGYGDADTVIVALPPNSIVIYVVKICLVFALVMTHPLGINYASEPLEQVFFPQALTATKTHPAADASETSPLIQATINEGEGENADALFWDEKSMKTINPNLLASSGSAGTQAAQSPVSPALEEFRDSRTDASTKTKVVSPATAQAQARAQAQGQQQQQQPKSWKRHGRIIIRTVLVVLTCAIGYTVPNFSTFSNFVGCFFLSFIGFIAPPAMYLKLTKERRWYHYATAVPLIVYGFAFLIIGTYSAVLHVLHPDD